MVLGFGAGSSSDAATRALAKSSEKYLGQSIVVQNVPGAASALAATQVAQSKPDGYTVLFTASAIVTLPHMEQQGFKPLEDFVPVIQVGSFTLLLLVRPDSPFKTVRDLVEYGKQNPGKLKSATSGVGTVIDLAGLLLSKAGGFQLTSIPFADASGVAQLMGGNVDMTFNTPSAALELIKQGQLRALGITASERHKSLADVPTLKEQGYDVEMSGWWALAVAKGTPDYIVKTIHDAVKQGLNDDPYASLMAKALQPTDYLDSAGTMKKWKSEYERIGELIKTARR